MYAFSMVFLKKLYAEDMPFLAEVSTGDPALLGGDLSPCERRSSEPLQFLERQSVDHLDDLETLARNINDREIGVDTIDAADAGQRIGAALDYFAFAGFCRVVHHDKNVPGTDRQVHRA